MKNFRLLAALFLFILTACTPQPPAVTPSAPTTTAATPLVAPPTPGATPAAGLIALTHATLIDGTGRDPIPDAVLLIQDEHILAAGPRPAVTIPANAQVIDLQGGFILPGFINAHVHNAYNSDRLRAWAQGGVTTVRDEGILSGRSLEEALTWRAGIRHDPQYARLVSAGHMLSVPKGYGSLFVESAADARQKVFEQLDLGVDNIKLSMEDGYAGQSGLPKLSAGELSAIVSAAHERRVPVSAHITQAAYLKTVVAAGVDDAAHLAYDPIPAETIQLMVAKDVYLIPTFTVFRNYQAPVETCVQNLAAFVKAGGKVALGNDFNGGPGAFEIGIPMYEIEMMHQAGMSPMQILVAATRNAAHVIGLEDELGTLETGKQADVLVISSDPLQELNALTHIQLVIHSGRIIFSK